MALKAWRVCFGNQAETLNLRSPFCAAVSLPPFLLSKHHTSKAIDLEVWPQLFLSMTGTRMEEMHEKEFQREETELAWSWQISYWHSTHHHLCHFRWILANSHKKKTCFAKERWNHRNISFLKSLRENSQNCRKDPPKLETGASGLFSSFFYFIFYFSVSRWKWLLFCDLSFSIYMKLDWFAQ